VRILLDIADILYDTLGQANCLRHMLSDGCMVNIGLESSTP